MFGHDDDHHEPNNMPANAPDTANLPVPADPLVGSMASDMSNDTAGDFEATPVPGNNIHTVQPITAPTTAPVAPASAAPTQTTESNNDLMDIKQQALQQLSPLMSHLEQTPEERFRTTMMMIQASDNDSLIKNAYDAALAIPDEKVRAQALLDVVNEINYFTQQENNTAATA